MPTLTSLLARDAIVSLDIVERALQRQVLDGGEIDTALLELAAVPENVLAAYRAASFDLPPAARAQLEELDRTLVQRVPGQLAREFRVVPIGIETDVLVLATDTPPQTFEIEQLTEALHGRVTFRIATELRVQEALAVHYGAAMPERMRGLAERLRNVSPGELCDVPRATPSREPIAWRQRVSARPPEIRRVTQPEGGIVAAVKNASAARSAEPPAAPGQMTWQQALEQLGKALNRDRVLDVFFAFARQYFDCSVLFVVRDDRLVPFRNAGAALAHAENGIRIVPGGAMHVAIQNVAPRVLDMRQSPSDAELLQVLGRAQHQPCAILPVPIRVRTIAVLYGDRSGAELSLPDCAELFPLLHSVGSAFQRIITERKRAQSAPITAPTTGDVPPPPRVPSELKLPEPEPEPQPRPEPIPRQPTIQLGGEDGERRSKPARTASYRAHNVPPEQVRTERRDEAKTLPERPSRLSDIKRIPLPPDFEASVATDPPPPRTLSSPPAGSGRYAAGENAVAVHADGRPAGSHPSPRQEREVTEPELNPRAEPSIVVDPPAREAERLADELARCTPDQGQDLIGALLRLGADALAALKRRFPGPLWFDRYKPRQRIPSGEDISAIARGVRAFEDKGIPVVAELMGGPQAEARLCALLLAAERPRAELIWPLYQRLFDSDGQVRLLALEVLPRYRALSQFDEVLKLLRERTGDDREPIASRLSALEAIGALRDAASVELLLKLCHHPSRQLSVPAHRNLLLITAQDFGDSERKWKAWFEKNRQRPRIEWLIESLMHSDERVRNTAGLELQKLTQVYYGFVAGGSKRDRERAQQRYREWLRHQVGAE